MAETIMGVLNNSEEPEWLEQEVPGPTKLRVWHVIFICLAAVATLIVMVCCCFRFRIPRTKQQIEADYQRRMVTSKFREHLYKIQDSKMDSMSLTDVLEVLNEKLMESKSNCGSQPSSGEVQSNAPEPDPEAPSQPEDEGQKPDGLSFVKFATKVATLSKIAGPKSPTPSENKMNF